MKIRTLSVIAVTVAITSACALFNRPPAEIDAVPSFGYGVLGDKNSGVVQAFNLAGNTYVQFLDLDRAQPSFIDAAGHQLDYKVSGQYAVLSGRVSSLTVSTNFGRSTIYELAKGDPSAAVAAAPAIASALAASPASSAPQTVRPAPELMTASFVFGPDQWQLSSLSTAQIKDLRATVEVMKMYADRQVRIVGYADASGSPSYNLRLSERRADELAKAFRNSGFKRVLAFGRGPRDQVADCTAVKNAVLRERCLAASRRVVIGLTL